MDVSVSIANDNITFLANNMETGVTYQWIDCITDQPVAGATNHNYTPTYGSDFAVIVTQDGCSDTSACMNSVVGLNDINVDVFVLYPNPTTDGMLNVSYDGIITNMEVIDMLGRVIALPMSVTNKTVNGAQLSSGKYMLRITTENGAALYQEFMVQK